MSLAGVVGARLARPVIIGLLSLIAACAHDVRTAFPGGGPCGPCATGTVVVELTQPATDLTVAVGGVVVAHQKNTRRVVVTNVPVGAVEVDVAMGGGVAARAAHHAVVEVRADREVSVVLPGPERSLAFAVQSGLVTAGAYVFLGLFYVAVL